MRYRCAKVLIFYPLPTRVTGESSKVIRVARHGLRICISSFFLCVCVFALLINNRTFVGPDFGPVVAKVISRRQELINETNDRQHFMLLSLYPSILVFPE